MELSTRARRTASWKIMAGLAVAGFVVALAGAAVIVATGSWYVLPPTDLTFADAEAAYTSCQQFVRPQFKTPGPVTFAPLGRRTTQRYVDGRYRVRSHADVVNGAGRLVEVRFSCTLRPTGVAQRWTLENTTIWTD
jgi:hypothetical protein